MMPVEDPKDRAATAVSGNWFKPGWMSDAGALLGLVLVSLVAGCLVNSLRAEPVPWIYASRAKTMDAAVASLSVSAAGQEAVQPTQEIRLEDFQVFVTDHKGLVLDARPKVFYEMAHIPGAMSLPREAFADEYSHLRETFQAYKDRPVVVYCSGADCTDSQLVADALTKLGFRHLAIYTSGWEEWSQTGLSQEGSATQP